MYIGIVLPDGLFKEYVECSKYEDCPNCGKKFHNKVCKFCPDCGEKLILTEYQDQIVYQEHNMRTHPQLSRLELYSSNLSDTSIIIFPEPILDITMVSRVYVLDIDSVYREMSRVVSEYPKEMEYIRSILPDPKFQVVSIKN